MTTTTLLRKCPICNEDRAWLEEALQSDLIWDFYPDGKSFSFFLHPNYNAAIKHLEGCKRCHRDLRGLIRKW